MKTIVPAMLPHNQPKGVSWIDALSECDGSYGVILGVCMAIDVKSGAIAAKVFADILDRINVGYTNARRAFAEAFNSHPSKDTLFFSSSLPCPPLTETEQYVRVVSVIGFITYFAGPSLGLLSLASDDIEKARKRYNIRPNDEPKTLETINVGWTGRNGVVWTTSIQDLDNLEKAYPKVPKASLVNDALGLGWSVGVSPSDPPELYVVNYPGSFDPKCSQPTLLDASWDDGDGFYLSCKANGGWGKTQSCSGNYNGVGERVHHEFEGLTSEFIGWYLGVSDIPSKNQSARLTEAFSRF